VLADCGVSDAAGIGQPRKLLRLINSHSWLDGERGASLADADNSLRLKDAPDRQPITLSSHDELLSTVRAERASFAKDALLQELKLGTELLDS